MTTPPEALREMGAEFRHAAAKCDDALHALESARQDRITFLREAIKRKEERLSDIKEEVRRLPEQIAKWEAERARLELQTGLDLLRAVVAERGENPAEPPVCDNPFVPGLPPLRLREVWAEWEDDDGDVVTFKGDKYRGGEVWWDIGPAHTWGGRYRPHGKTRAEVEAMADAAERKPALLDLRGLKVGTTVLFEADAIGGAGGGVVKKGYSVAIKAMSGAGVLVTWHDGLWERWIAPLQPARVVEVPR